MDHAEGLLIRGRTNFYWGYKLGICQQKDVPLGRGLRHNDVAYVSFVTKSEFRQQRNVYFLYNQHQCNILERTSLKMSRKQNITRQLQNFIICRGKLVCADRQNIGLGVL